MRNIRILFLGDIIGGVGRRVLQNELASLKKELFVDFVIANIENSAGGFGLTYSVYEELLSFGVDAFTSGNHVYTKRESHVFFNQMTKLVRPLNFPKDSLGQGWRIVTCKDRDILLINLVGQVFMGPNNCPFESVSNFLEFLSEKPKIIVVDFHAEATSEKQAMGWFLNGKVSMLLGTHTHVQTADSRILDLGTAYISDVGMVGSEQSVIGMNIDPIVHNFTTHMPIRKEVSKKDPFILNAVLVKVDEDSGESRSIERIYRHYNLKN